MLAWAAAHSPDASGVEIKTNLFSSFANIGQPDLVALSHNTILFELTEGLHAGLLYSFESYSQTTTDQTQGCALRLGGTSYLELQGGALLRLHTENGRKLSSQGWSGSLVLGHHLNSWLGVALFLTNRRLASGDLAPRSIVEAMPYLNLRFNL